MSTELESRLNDLEARLRRQQWLSMISLCLLVAALGWTWQSARPGAADRSTLEATRFVLRDAAGKERGVWEVDVAAIRFCSGKLDETRFAHSANQITFCS